MILRYLYSPLVHYSLLLAALMVAMNSNSNPLLARVLFFCALFTYYIWRTEKGCTGWIGKFPHCLAFHLSVFPVLIILFMGVQQSGDLMQQIMFWLLWVVLVSLEAHLKKAYRWDLSGIFLALFCPWGVAIAGCFAKESALAQVGDTEYDGKPVRLGKFLSQNSAITEAARVSSTLRLLLSMAEKLYHYKSARIVSTGLRNQKLRGFMAFEEGIIALDKDLEGEAVPIVFAHELSHLIFADRFSLFQNRRPLNLGDYMSLRLEDEATAYYYASLVQRELGLSGSYMGVMYTDDSGEPVWFDLASLVTSDEKDSIAAVLQFIRDRHIISESHMRRYPPEHHIYKSYYFGWALERKWISLNYKVHHHVDEVLSLLERCK